MSKPVMCISAGFKEDCKKLLNQFEQCEGVRFQDFSNTWQDMKFSLVFRGRQSFIELLQFCEEALHIAKTFILPPNRFRTQLGGLYLLYGIYYKMPCRTPKIRVTLSEWKNVLELHDNIKEGNHTDANYILAKMIVDEAFHYCSFPKEFGLERTLRNTEIEIQNKYSLLPILKDMTEPGQVLAKIEALSDAYHKVKCGISNDDRPKRGLDMFDVETSTQLIKKIAQLENSREITENTRNVNNDQPVVSNEKDSTNKNNTSKYFRKKLRPKLGDGYDSGTSEESLEVTCVENYSPNLPNTFDFSSNESD